LSGVPCRARHLPSPAVTCVDLTAETASRLPRPGNGSPGPSDLLSHGEGSDPEKQGECRQKDGGATHRYSSRRSSPEPTRPPAVDVEVSKRLGLNVSRNERGTPHSQGHAVIRTDGGFGVSARGDEPTGGSTACLVEGV